MTKRLRKRGSTGVALTSTTRKTHLSPREEKIITLLHVPRHIAGPERRRTHNTFPSSRSQTHTRTTHTVDLALGDRFGRSYPRPAACSSPTHGSSLIGTSYLTISCKCLLADTHTSPANVTTLCVDRNDRQRLWMHCSFMSTIEHKTCVSCPIKLGPP